MNYIFFILIASSIIYGVINEKASEITTAMFDGANIAVKTAFALIGIMSLWLGIMRIAEKSGFVQLLAKLVSPLMKVLFKDIPPENPANANITLSITSNALGLTNAATPIGLKVMQNLQELNKDKSSASNAMCMFLGMNTAGFQIIPATVLAILVGSGAKNPTEIILPTLIVTSGAFIIAIITAKILSILWSPQKEEQNAK